MTQRATLYARYSTDKQRETSITDQLREAHARADREGWHVVATHADEGVSGSTPLAMRAGGKALMADALAKRFDVLIVEGLDRLSREIGEAETVVKRLEHRGVRIIGTADGYDTEARGRKVMRIARGLVNELYLDDLREKTHRGLAGQFERGFHAGGRTYGYTSAVAEDGQSRRMVIDDAEAAVVRWVFEQFADGHSTRHIAHQLNAQGKPSARGGTWAVSALQGSSEKGLGMLNNELYIGRVIWNRRQWLKDPETGRRRYVERPKEEWQVREAPELRIVSAELWLRVQDRARRGPARGTRTGKGAIPRTLFAGVLRCHACGAAFTAINSKRYGCSAHRDRGAAVCGSSVTLARDMLDKRLLAEVREELLNPEALAMLQREVGALLADLQRQASGDAAAAPRQLKALDAEIARLVDAVAAVGISPALQQRLRTAETERDRLAQLIEQAEAGPRQVIEDVLARYRRQVLELQRVLDEDADRDRTRQLLADMLGPVLIGRDADTGATWAEMEKPAERLALNGSPVLVAGAGFEPTTFGL
ncbi:MAG: recombinase family protein [Comamonadaceae bacterium]|nr:recombinase family protein [Comamonadaceae bacterium]